MKRLIIGTSAIALIAIPAWAMAKDHKGMHGPQTRAQVEAKVKEHFAKVDANKDGAITREEADAFKTARRAEMRDKRFAMLDADKNGSISREEFDAHHAGGKDKGHHMGGRHGGKDMMGGRMFAKADANNDGKVTMAEATAKALEKFDRADANKDGTVTPEERRAGWQKWKETRQNKSPAG
ncbi:MAG: EF-hand domain-containing protein [Sphingomonadaceae bacterium]